ncbi:MAG: MutS-related protein [Sciscionella sp.]
MKAHLMHRDRDFDLRRTRPANEHDLTQDLELNALFGAMALGDEFLHDIARIAVLCSHTDLATISYRQDVLRDCLEKPTVVRGIYDLAVEAIQRERKHYFSILNRSPDAVLHRSRAVLEMFVEMLKRLRGISDEHAAAFSSEGFTALFAMLRRELDDAYLERVDDHLRELTFRQGTPITAELGAGNRGSNYVLRKPRKHSWREWLSFGDRSAYTIQIPDRDDAGARAVGELRDRGVNLVANALAQSNDHILGFFTMLRAELGFYVGCLNLHDTLRQKGEPICFPEPVASEGPTLSASGLYDVCLSLAMGERTVGNGIAAAGKSLVMITGANQGGKSTMLRSVGLAQLMTQCGMFVAAQSFRADVRSAVFTHFKREEDATMTSGKLDEELGRMSGILDAMGAGAMVLCNESFASTNEREGSAIATEIIRALVETGTKVLFVTHLFDLAHGFYQQHPHAALFLRAERAPAGHRTFRLVPGEPLSTSYGEDLYRRIFGTSPDPASGLAPVSGARRGERP